MGSVELGGCAKCSKYLLIVFNVLLFLTGVALLAVGIWVIVQPYQIEVLMILDNPLIQNSAYLIIAIGAFIVIVSGLGCCGACMSSKCMLVLYFIIVLIIVIAQIVGCALVLAYKSKVDDFVTNQLAATMDNYNGENATDSISTGWNALQILLKCCGTTGYQDWENTTWGNSNPNYTVDGREVTQMYPLTCCKFTDPNVLLTGTSWPEPSNITECLTNPSASVLNMGGCYTSFNDFVARQIYYVGGVGIGLLVFELLVMIFSIALCRGISAGEQVV